MEHVGGGGGRQHFIFVLTEGQREGHIYRRIKMKLKSGGGGTGGGKKWTNLITMVLNMGRRIFSLPHLA